MTLKLYEQNEFRGKIFLEDTLAQAPRVVAPEAIIYLSDAKSYTSIVDVYSYSTKADKEGIFDLVYQPVNKEDVFLTGKYTNAGGIPFENYYKLSDLPKANGEIELLLRPRYPKGVLKVWLKDKNPGGVPIVGADVYLFANKEQAATIKDATPQGSIQKSTTNSQGVAVLYNLELGKYYVIAKSTGVESYSLTKLDSVTISDVVTTNYPKTINYRALQYPDPPMTKSSILVTVKENNAASPLTDFQVYLFTSQSQAMTINDTEVKGYIQVVSTNSSGMATLKNIDVGTYYIAVRGAIGGNPKATSGPRKVNVTSGTVRLTHFYSKDIITPYNH